MMSMISKTKLEANISQYGWWAGDLFQGDVYASLNAFLRYRIGEQSMFRVVDYDESNDMTIVEIDDRSMGEIVLIHGDVVEAMNKFGSLSYLVQALSKMHSMNVENIDLVKEHI